MERGSVSSRVTLSPSALRTTGLVYPGSLNPISGCAQDYSHGESHPPSSLTPSPLRRLMETPGENRQYRRRNYFVAVYTRASKGTDYKAVRVCRQVKAK